MQGSVHRFDPASGAGSVLLDNGVEVPFDHAAFVGSGLRLLRIGQRLSLELAPDDPDASDGPDSGDAGDAGGRLRVTAMHLRGI